MVDVDAFVRAQATAARQAWPSLLEAPPAALDRALRVMAASIRVHIVEVLAANRADLEEAGEMSRGLLDRLTLTPRRLEAMAVQLESLASIPRPPEHLPRGRIATGQSLVERRIPIGVVGANYEARPNVTVDIASQLIKSRNAGLLRTGSAAARSARALMRCAVRPALDAVGLDPAAIQLIEDLGHDSARALVALPDIVPLVILRGSGQSTRDLARHAAVHGVRTLAHADGGGVLYLHKAADPNQAARILEESLDRFGVCNRLNLLLCDQEAFDEMWPTVEHALARLDVRPSLPPHPHRLGHEWALDEDDHVVTVLPVAGLDQAVSIANEETSGLAAAIVTEDEASARRFMSIYRGTGVFWNSPTRLLDGYKLFPMPETGINLDRTPGPRGPVTFADLYITQWAVSP